MNELIKIISIILIMGLSPPSCGGDNCSFPVLNELNNIEAGVICGAHQKCKDDVFEYFCICRTTCLCFVNPGGMLILPENFCNTSIITREERTDVLKSNLLKSKISTDINNITLIGI
jgi:hypothetical protein